jgi:hypothetical protein
MRAEERLAALFPDINLRTNLAAGVVGGAATAQAGANAASAVGDAGVAAKDAEVAAAAAASPLVASPLGALGSRIAAALSSLTQGALGAGAAPRVSQLRELRMRLPTTADRSAMLSQYGVWLGGLREQLLSQHLDAQAQLVALRVELESASGDLARSQGAATAIQEQLQALDSAKWSALAKYEEAQVCVCLCLGCVCLCVCVCVCVCMCVCAYVRLCAYVHMRLVVILYARSWRLEIGCQGRAET